ncbi:DUF4864 domain-containing protein [Roseovarius aestuariivivens]|uniref:DUF4864 domain-containing protein n=1 Tax=Roseovarius aestuariivivens TaxID=1888910 RepID=UPI001080F52F|nr:DUF4864 domain-containing protein [Roseovarius aestuariivivens]
MKTWILTIVAALILLLPARADEAARQVISDQIAAFLEDDFETAFTYASPKIKQIFGGPERFGEMVQHGYPMVWRPADVKFLNAEQIGAGLRQGVLVRDAAGVFYELDYEMIAGQDGWKIDGVRIRQLPEGNA